MAHPDPSKAAQPAPSLTFAAEPPALLSQGFLKEHGLPPLTNGPLAWTQDDVCKVIAVANDKDIHTGSTWLCVAVMVSEARVEPRLAGYFLFLCHPAYKCSAVPDRHKSQCSLFFVGHCYATACLEGLIGWSFSIAPSTYRPLFPAVHIPSSHKAEFTLGMPIPCSGRDLLGLATSIKTQKPLSGRQLITMIFSGAGDVVEHVHQRNELNGYAYSRNDSLGAYFVLRLSAKTANGSFADGFLVFHGKSLDPQSKEPIFGRDYLKSPNNSNLSISGVEATQVWGMAAMRLHQAGIRLDVPPVWAEHTTLEAALDAAAPVLPHFSVGAPLLLNEEGVRLLGDTKHDPTCVLSATDLLGVVLPQYRPAAGRSSTAFHALFGTGPQVDRNYGYVLVTFPRDPVKPASVLAHHFFAVLAPEKHEAALCAALSAISACYRQSGWRGALQASEAPEHTGAHWKPPVNGMQQFVEGGHANRTE